MIDGRVIGRTIVSRFGNGAPTKCAYQRGCESQRLDNMRKFENSEAVRGSEAIAILGHERTKTLFVRT